MLSMLSLFQEVNGDPSGSTGSAVHAPAAALTPHSRGGSLSAAGPGGYNDDLADGSVRFFQVILPPSWRCTHTCQPTPSYQAFCGIMAASVDCLLTSPACRGRAPVSKEEASQPTEGLSDCAHG